MDVRILLGSQFENYLQKIFLIKESFFHENLVGCGGWYVC